MGKEHFHNNVSKHFGKDAILFYSLMFFFYAFGTCIKIVLRWKVIEKFGSTWWSKICVNVKFLCINYFVELLFEKYSKWSIIFGIGSKKKTDKQSSGFFLCCNSVEWYRKQPTDNGFLVWWVSKNYYERVFPDFRNGPQPN